MHWTLGETVIIRMKKLLIWGNDMLCGTLREKEGFQSQFAY